MSITKITSNKLLEERRAVTEGPSVSLITKGRKIIIDGPRAVVATAGEMLYTPAGTHYIDPEPYEEVIVNFSKGELAHMLAVLSEHFGLQINEHIQCPKCEGKYTVCLAQNDTYTFFTSLAAYTPNPTVEKLKKMELLALLAADSECCIQRRIFEDSDPEAENFEAIINANILKPLSLKEIARMTGCSTTALKGKFKKHFDESPHAYMTRRRLAHARMLLISTNKPIAEIGSECAFSNSSHFIKLFGKEYEMTPATYRKRHSRE